MPSRSIPLETTAYIIAQTALKAARAVSQSQQAVSAIIVYIYERIYRLAAQEYSSPGYAGAFYIS